MRLSEAIELITRNAEQHEEKAPTLGTLLAEVAELARSLEGKHEHPPELELIQIGGIAANILKRYSLADAQQAVQDRLLEQR